jgi:hypothetical protein
MCFVGYSFAIHPNSNKIELLNNLMLSSLVQGASEHSSTASGGRSQHAIRHRRHMRTSATPLYHPATIHEHPDEEQWIDGPRSTVDSASAASRMGGLTSDYATRRSTSERSRRQPPVLPDTELWVDGPAEFQTHKVPSSTMPGTSGCIEENRSRKGRPSPAYVTSTGVSRVDHSTITASSLPNKTAQISTIGCTSQDDVVDRKSADKSSLHKNSTSNRLQQRSHLPPPDGRVAAWVQSVCEAAQTTGTLNKCDLARDLYQPDGNESSDVLAVKAAGCCGRMDAEPCGDVIRDSGDCRDVAKDGPLSCADEDDDGKSSSCDAAGSGHSMYEKKRRRMSGNRKSGDRCVLRRRCSVGRCCSAAGCS